jgi:translation initiation factor IF-3
VIGAGGEMLGIMQTHAARKLAREQNLDLVEVNPKANPPVCKIMDFGRFKYEEKKKQSDAKRRQTKVELKEVKLRPKTDDHDVDFKTKHVRRFIEEGNKVKITVRFRGREITHPETAQRQIDVIVKLVEDIAVVEQPPRMEARTMTAIVAPRAKPQVKPVKAATDKAQPADESSAEA